MADENIADKQQIESAIPDGFNGVRLTITHNLQDRNGNHLTPDEVIAEIIDYPDYQGANFCNMAVNRIPSDPEDGTYQLEVRGSEVNASGSDLNFVLKVTSLYHHSVQSDDHTFESTAKEGTGIDDCTPAE